MILDRISNKGKVVKNKEVSERPQNKNEGKLIRNIVITGAFILLVELATPFVLLGIDQYVTQKAEIERHRVPAIVQYADGRTVIDPIIDENFDYTGVKSFYYYKDDYYVPVGNETPVIKYAYKLSDDGKGITVMLNNGNDLFIPFENLTKSK